MIEVYAFLAAFTVQILVVSVLQPVWMAQYVRAKADVQLLDWGRASRERFLTLYRVANAGIAVVGLVLLAWVFSNMQRPDWNFTAATTRLSLYGAAQTVPFLVVSLIGVWYKKRALLRAPLPVKRKASLERRGLFDIVSPLIVFVAVLVYFPFAGFMIYIHQHQAQGILGYRLLGSVTLAYALNALCVYWLLYRRKRWPLETPAYRMQAVDVQVRLIFYVSVAIVLFQSLCVTLKLLHMLNWMPFAQSVYFVIVMGFVSMVLFVLRRQAEQDRLAPAPAF